MLTTGQWLWIAGSLVIMGAFAAWWYRFQRQRKRGPTGVGAALALALEGDLKGAQALLESLVRSESRDASDALIGLIAVLRHDGQFDRAERILSRIEARGGGATWLPAVRVRTALDSGNLEQAATIAMDNPQVPVDLAVAALARSGRWRDALAMYRVRLGRRQRSRILEASLLAGVAVLEASEGQSRTAWKRLRRALSLAPESLLPLVITANLHPKEAERHRFAQTLRHKFLGLALHPDMGGQPVVDSVVAEANAFFADGRTEAALACLREHLDLEPKNWPVRARYVEWMLEHGEPEDWRSELAEILELNSQGQMRSTVRCMACGYQTGESFFICPQCDAFGTLARYSKALDSSKPRCPSEKGTGMAELVALLHDLPLDDHG